MSQTSKIIGPNRYRESFGRYYEDFNVGDVYEHRRPTSTRTRSSSR
jgi:itaconyl-CoA hydratase